MAVQKLFHEFLRGRGILFHPFALLPFYFFHYEGFQDVAFFYVVKAF